MCEHLLKAGHSVVVYNRSPARLASLLEIGAVAASSPKDVRCLAFIFVSDLISINLGTYVGCTTK